MWSHLVAAPHQGIQTSANAIPAIVGRGHRDRGQGDLDTGCVLGNRIKVEERTHTIPKVEECRPQADIHPLMDDKSGEPRNDNCGPWSFVPCFKTMVLAGILPNFESRKSRGHNILSLFESNASGAGRLQRGPTLR